MNRDENGVIQDMRGPGERDDGTLSACIERFCFDAGAINANYYICRETGDGTNRTLYVHAFHAHVPPESFVTRLQWHLIRLGYTGPQHYITRDRYNGIYPMLEFSFMDYGAKIEPKR